jgi:hypothetical protein
MNDALLELVYGDPRDAWRDTPLLGLSGPRDSRLDADRRAGPPADATMPCKELTHSRYS